MISHLTLKFGRAAGLSPETIPGTPVTVFVGPNNSGKSKVLQEIDHFCRTGTQMPRSVVLDHMIFVSQSESDALTAIEHIRQDPNPDEVLSPGQIIVGSKNGRQHIMLDQLKTVIQDPNANPSGFCSWFLSHSTLMLNGTNRINLVTAQGAGDLQSAPQSSFQVLFRDSSKRSQVRRIVSEAFGSYFVVDPTNMGQLRLRLSPRSPSNELEECGIHSEAREFHRNAPLIDHSSDGVKAFTGIVTEVMAGDPQVLLIDEPEAFLHPSLAFKLGKEVSQAATTADKRVFASTHSPQFVMGCIQSGAPVSIIRLTFRGGVATARVLPSQEILELMRRPLLRSTGVISGLFYEFVVVTESDTDRAFYQEINERLLRFKPEWGIPNCLFLNAQNKQTVPTILQPLRKLGIPAAGIVDIDVVKEGGTPWSRMMSGLHVPSADRPDFDTARNFVRTAMDATGLDMKQGGISILDSSQQGEPVRLLSRLQEYGLFVVPCGELESWLKPLGASGHGPNWLIDMFEKMGENPDDVNYLKPNADDVWVFMNALKEWLINPNRKGIPE